MVFSESMSKEKMNSKSPQLPWHSRFDLQGITFALFLLLGISSLPALEGSGRDLDYWGNLKGFLDQFLPPDFDILPQTLAGIWETIQIAGISTLLALCFPSFLLWARPVPCPLSGWSC